jgi:hypothetical protein
MKTTSIVARYLLGLMFTVFRVEWISQLYPPAAAHESAGVTVSWRHHRIALCGVLLRGAGVWWAVAVLRPIRANLR